MKNTFYIFIGIIITVAVFVLGYFQIKRIHKINTTYNGMVQILDFINVEFPEQSKDYMNKLQALKEQQAQKPTKPISEPK